MYQHPWHVAPNGANYYLVALGYKHAAPLEQSRLSQVCGDISTVSLTLGSASQWSIGPKSPNIENKPVKRFWVFGVASSHG